ncbi:hypothetical protein AB1N83_005464 [Pleurotus pulmonarius]
MTSGPHSSYSKEADGRSIAARTASSALCLTSFSARTTVAEEGGGQNIRDKGHRRIATREGSRSERNESEKHANGQKDKGQRSVALVASLAAKDFNIHPSISPISQQSQIAWVAPEDADIPPRLQSQRSITPDVHRVPAPPPTSRQSLALDGIPVEIFEEIITYLSVKDLCNLAQCSSVLCRWVNGHHVWYRVAEDIQDTRPLPYPVDLTTLTCAALKNLAIRAFRLHHRLSMPLDRTVRLVHHVEFDLEQPIIADAVMLPNGRYVLLFKDGSLRLVSLTSGQLHSCPPLSEPPQRSCYNSLVAAHVSVDVSHVVHYIQYFAPYYQTIRESVVKIYAVTTKFQLILELHSPHEIIACAATRRTFAFVRIDPQGQAYVRLFAISQDASVPPSPDGREIKLLDSEPNEYTFRNPFAVSLALASQGESHDFVFLTNSWCICVYRIPTDLADGSSQRPLWKHMSTPPFLEPCLRVVPLPPSSCAEAQTHLRLTLYDKGSLTLINLHVTPTSTSSPPGCECTAAAQGRIRLFPHFTLGNCFVHVGASVVIAVEDIPRDFRCDCLGASFLFAGPRPTRQTDRLECGETPTLIQGAVRLLGETVIHRPILFALDEGSGLLLFITWTSVFVYSIL